MTFCSEANMDVATGKDYFLQPLDVWHRRYEVLRAVFVDEQPMQEVAQRFCVSYGTVRNWVGEFRHYQDAGLRPPFSPHLPGVVPRVRPTTANAKSRSPMSRRCHWRRVGD
jgi:Homeodomain-like domain